MLHHLIVFLLIWNCVLIPLGKAKIYFLSDCWFLCGHSIVHAAKLPLVFLNLIGHLHDDVILLLRPESFRTLLSCAN